MDGTLPRQEQHHSRAASPVTTLHAHTRCRRGLIQGARNLADALAPPPAFAVPLFFLLLVASLLPVLVVEIPAGVDVPNHLARMGLLSRKGEAHPYYDVHWRLYPNLAIDLVVPALARILSVETAMKVFYVASQLLVVTGALAIELAHKRRFEFAGFVALGSLYSIPFAWGFVNFTFGCGIALWGIALHLICRERSTGLRLALHAGIVAMLFISHFFALGIYGLAVGIIELWRWWPTRRTLSALLVTGAWLAAPVLVLLVVLALAAEPMGPQRTLWSAGWKPISLLMSINGYSWTLSAALSAGALLLLYLLVRNRALRAHQLGWWMGGGFAFVFFAMPFRIFDTAFVDIRLVTAATLILPAFFSVRHIGAKVRRTVVYGGVALLVANIAFVAYVQLSYDRSYDEMLASFRYIDGGSRVLVGATGTASDPPPTLVDYPMYNAPVLAVWHRDAFVPNLFTSPGKQPLVVRRPVRDLDIPYGGPVPVDRLRATTAGRDAATPAFIAHWREDYDYLVVVGEETGVLMPDVLERLDGGHRFTLYRVRPSSGRSR